MEVLSKKSSRSDLQNKDRAVICALVLEEDSRPTYSRECLSVTMWQKYPATFGLKGYETEYPDTHQTLLAILKAVRNHKLLHRNGSYMLSVQGRSEAYKLTSKHNIPITKKGAFAAVGNIPLHAQEFVEKLLDSEAYHLQQQSNRSHTFLCACKFWGLQYPGSKGDEVRERLAEFRTTLLSVASAIKTKTIFNSGRVVTRKEIYNLINLSSDLEINFRKYLTLMMERK